MVSKPGIAMLAWGASQGDGMPGLAGPVKAA
jgi:hypothetical protein